MSNHFIKTSFFSLLKLAGRQLGDADLHGEWSVMQLAKCSGEKWHYKGNSELSKHEDYWLYIWVNLCKIKAWKMKLFDLDMFHAEICSKRGVKSS